MQVLNSLNVALIDFVDLLQARYFRNLLVLEDLLPRDFSFPRWLWS
jgi:hypothetical protein